MRRWRLRSITKKQKTQKGRTSHIDLAEVALQAPHSSY